MNVLEINDNDFQTKVVDSNIPVLLDFYANWCGPCKAISPILNELSVMLNGKLKICKMDIDKSPLTPSKFGVQSIPTLFLFNNGKLISSKVGGASLNDLKAWIEDNID